ncbi:MAG: hypothetical protein AAF234_18040 [Pseudomonadota bacterium]
MAENFGSRLAMQAILRGLFSANSDAPARWRVVSLPADQPKSARSVLLCNTGDDDFAYSAAMSESYTATDISVVVYRRLNLSGDFIDTNNCTINKREWRT